MHLQTVTVVEFLLKVQKIISKGLGKAHFFLHSLAKAFAKKPSSAETATDLAKHGPGLPKPSLAVIRSPGSPCAIKCVC